MKIVELGYTYLPMHGGEEHWIDVFSRFLDAEGHRVIVVQRGFTDEFPDGKPKRLTKNLSVVPAGFMAPPTVNGPVIDRQPLYNLFSIPTLWRVTKQGDIIVVVYPQLFFPAAWLVKKIKRAKVICVSVGITWDSPHQTFKEKMLYAMVRFLERLALKGADRVVAIDTRYVREAEKFDRKSMHKVRIIPNFVHTDFYSPKGKKKGKLILCPRNLRHARGVDLAIEGMKIVNAEYRDAKLLILGDGPLREQLEALIKKLGVNAEIRHSVDKTTLRDYYRKASIVVVPSRYSEGSSFAGIEAMSCGTPIVVTDTGGLPDIVRDNHNGFMVKPEGSAVGTAMLRILQDKKLAAGMGKNGRAMALKKFSYAMFCREWRKVLDEMTKVKL